MAERKFYMSINRDLLPGRILTKAQPAEQLAQEELKKETEEAFIKEFGITKEAAEKSAAEKEEDPVLFSEDDKEEENEYPTFGNDFLESLDEDEPKYLSPAERRKQKTSDSMFNTYNTGEEWLMSDGDDLAKGFINNFRSAIGTGVEDFAFWLTENAPWYKPAQNVVEKNIAGKVEEQAQKQFGNAKANGVNGKVVDFMDNTSKNLGYSLLGFKAGDYAQSIGEGFNEYRNLREQGYSKEEAARKSLISAGASLAGEKALDKGGDLFINNLLGKRNYGVKADFETNIPEKTPNKTEFEDFFGEKKEITDVEHEEILQFKNCEYKMDIQNGVSCFPKDDDLHMNIQKVKPEKFEKTNVCCFDVGMHGNPKNVALSSTKDAPIMTPKALAVVISQNKNYKKGQPVRLLSCSTGKEIPFDDCFAQKLANELNVSVVAPKDTLYINESGKLKVGKSKTGGWETFSPKYSINNEIESDWRTQSGGRKR